MQIPFHHKVYRKLVYTFHLWDSFPVAEHLTKEERNVLDLNIMKEIDGWLTTKEAIALFRIAKRLKRKCTIVEIGTWKGKSTFVLAKGLGSKGEIICIDPFDATAPFDKASEKTYKSKTSKTSLFLQFKRKMVKLKVWNKITPFKGYSSEYNSKRAIDFLFIDGDHSKKGCMFDFAKFSPLIKKGGFIGFHDYNENRKKFGVTQTVDLCVADNNEYKYVGLYDSLWVAQKVS